MDITDFYDTFFEEAEELLADMERHLLELDIEAPDAEQLNAIFRAAHSIKGGAGTFGFDALQKTTHLFENLLDHTRRGELTLRRDVVDSFLETKDILHDQLDAYRNGHGPDQEAFARICRTLQQLARETGTTRSSASSSGIGDRTESESVPVSRSIRVPVGKVDQIINLVGELIITQSMLDQAVGELDGVTKDALVHGMNLLQRNARDLQEAVMSIRMVPMDFVFSRFPRVVHDLASKLGKDVELITEGETSELDKILTERISDPLTHLVRNSLDHGIEPPDQREAAGKPRTGKLVLAARHQGGNILIEVADDGAGLDRGRLLAKARDNGLNVSETMSDDAVWQLIFTPGFSTAREVTDVSGRGVGMDVVKRNIQGMGGHVKIMSTPGEGTTIRIILPLTLAILDGMSIKVGSEMFILPLSEVLESLRPAKEDLYAMVGGDLALKVHDEYLPVVTVHEALDVRGAKTELSETIAVIVQDEIHRYALLVDDLVGRQQVVVKNLETPYRKVPGVSAATLLEDGSVAPILDITGLQRLCREKRRCSGQARVDTFSNRLP